MASHCQTPWIGSHSTTSLAASVGLLALFSVTGPCTLYAWVILNTTSLEYHVPSLSPGLLCALPSAKAMIPTSSICLLLMFQVKESFLLEAIPNHPPYPAFPSDGAMHSFLAFLLHSALLSHSDCLTRHACPNVFPMDHDVCMGKHLVCPSQHCFSSTLHNA